MEFLWDVFKDAAIDCLKMLPFLFLAFFFIELLEQKAAAGMNRTLKKAGALGPLAGAGLGLVPQCGFSVLASNFYVGGLISMGTLLAVYLATSDEALVIMLTEPGHMKDIPPLLISKFLIALIFGYLIYFAEKATGKGVYRKALEEREKHLREAETLLAPEIEAPVCGCGCGQPCAAGDAPASFGERAEAAGKPSAAGDAPASFGKRAEAAGKPSVRRARRIEWKRALWPAFRKTEEIFLYLFLVTFVLNVLVELVGLENLSKFLLSGTPLEPLIAVFIGLIPNCAASVALTQLYFEGVLSFGAAVGGLAAGAGLGLLVLFRVGKNVKTNLLVLGLLFVISVLSGSLLMLILK